MKKTTLVVLLALVLTFAFASGAFATTGKFFAGGVNYYQWSRATTSTWEAANGTTTPAGVTAFINDGVSSLGANPGNPGVHANYLANTAKCAICHSVHRADAAGTKLMRTSDASCAGCHTTGTTVTTKLVTWTAASTTWVPEISPASPDYPGGTAGTTWQNAWIGMFDPAAWAGNPDPTGPTQYQKNLWTAAWAAVTNKAAAGGAASVGGPHNDSLVDMVGDGLWSGAGTPPAPDYEGYRYGCFTRRCHASNPHGANSSKYKLFAAKLLFNDKDATGTYGGLDAEWDAMGPTDAAVERFVKNNASIMSTTPAGDILINGVAPDANEEHALVAGLTCGRPSNSHGGEDECHAEASYAIVDKGIKENRNKGTGLAGTDYRTDNTQAELPGFGGNDSRTSKTGHVAGTFGAVPEEGSYVAINGCTSCHDQTDSAASSGFTFPHGQVAAGASNLSTDGVNVMAPGAQVRSRIWSGWSANAGAIKRVTGTSPAGQKAFDGQCLKCHRDGVVTSVLPLGSGIGLTK